MSAPPLAALRLVVTAAPRRAVLVLALEAFGSLLATGQVVASAALVAGVLELVTTDGPVSALAVPLAALTAVTLLSGVLQAAVPRAGRLLGEQVARATWARVLDVSSRVPLVAFDTPAFADSLQRVRQHGIGQPVRIASAVARLVGSGLTVVALVAYLVSVHWSLPVLALLAGTPTLVTTRVVGRREFAFAVAQDPAQRRRIYLADLLVQRSAAEEVRSFGLGAWLTARHDEELDRYTGALRGHLSAQARLEAVGAVLTAVLTVGTLLALVLLLQDGAIGVAQAAGAALALRVLAGRAVQAAGSAGALYQGGLFMTDLRTFLASEGLEPEPQPAGVEEAPGSAPAHVQLRGVGFTYPGAARASLSDIDLDLGPGRVVALVGENGSGKTTLAKVVAQLHAPTAGEVRWNGHVVVDARRPTLRQRVAVLFQDFGRYALTAQQNVELGRVEAPPDGARLARAAHAAGLGDLVEALPQGWTTSLGPQFGGQDLSGGQWQRLALARAHFREAPLVVLDEPTAALDPRAEAELFTDVGAVLAGRTVLLVTHRLASARSADEIVVMSAGRIAQRGTHDQLVGSPGVYADLWRMQATAYEESSAL